MKRLLALCAFLLCAIVPSARAQVNNRAWGYCAQGGVLPTVSGLQLQTPDGSATQKVMASYPGCTVTVYFSGTLSLATIFSDTSNTPLANPFTANSTTGYWFFYVANGRYDVQLSGAGIPATFTLGDIAVGSSGGGGGSGGATPAPPPFVLQKANSTATNLAPSSIFDNGTKVTVGEPLLTLSDFQSTGPNPYLDARSYGVRSVNPSIAPAVPGITATINSGQSTATISSASTFQNGDGVTVFGAGAANSMVTPSAPTVTPSVASAGTGTGLVANGPTGATTYNYQIVARDTNGGLTAASAVGSTSTGLASLGYQTVAITSISKSGTLNTVTTSAPHTLAVGALVDLLGTTDDTDFSGWVRVAGTTDNTHFTYYNGFDSANGAGTSATGGSVSWWNCNHLSWTQVTGAFMYYIYGRTGGSLTLLGVSKPSGTVVDLTWDDFGSPMMDGFIAPFYVPTTPPGAATNDNLTTTILTGAGTTSIGLANAAISSVSNGTILFDDAPTLLAAINAQTSIGGEVFLPSGSYVINSVLSLPGLFGLSQSGSLTLNDTVLLSGGFKWNGDQTTTRGAPPQFSFAGYPTIFVNRANPGMYGAVTNSSIFHGLNILAATNPTNMIILDQNVQDTFDSLNFLTVQGSGDYMGMGLIFRAPVNNGAFFNVIKNTEMIGSQGLHTSTPIFYCQTCGSLQIDNISMSGRGLYVGIPQDLSIRYGRVQAASMPFLMYGNFPGSFGGGAILIRGIELDTMGSSLISNIIASAGVPDVSGVTIENSGFPSFNGGGKMPNLSGSPVGAVLCIAGCGVVQTTRLTALGGGAVITSGSGQGIQAQGISTVGYQNTLPNAPTIVLGGVGSCVANCVASGTYFYTIAANDIYGHSSSVSACSAPVTTDGTKTITVSWVPLDGQLTTNPFRGPPGGACNNQAGLFVIGSGISGTSYIDASTNFYSVSVPLSPNFQSTSIGSLGLTGPQVNFTGGGFESTRKGTFTANRIVTLVDATFTEVAPNLPNTFTANQTLSNGTELHFISNDLTHFAGFKGGASTINLVWLFPTTDATGTQCLSSNGSLQLSWSNCSAGTGTPGGASTNVQYNQTGSFAGANSFTFNGTGLVGIGLNATTLGQLQLFGNTSGSVTIQPQAVAGGSLTFTLPNASGTAQVSASAPLVASATSGNLTCPSCTTNAAAATANQLMIGSGGQAIAALGSLGTTTTVLHGNAGGAPTFGAVNLGTDVTGAAAIGNGGTGQTTASTAFNALAPATATGGLILGSGANTYANLAIGGNGLCLVSNGTTAAWASCASGAVGGNGVAGQVTFWNAVSTISGNVNWTYAVGSGQSLTQGANAVDAFFMKRFTDTIPTGNFLHFQNAAANTDVAKLDVNGNLSVSGSIGVAGAAIAGTISLGQGPTPALVANTIGLVAPTSVAVSGELFVYPGNPSSGFIRWTNSTGILTGNFAPASGVGTCSGTQLVSQTNDNAAPTCTNVLASMFTSQSANQVLAAPNGSAGVPTFRTLVSADLPAILLNSSGNGGVTNILQIANGGTNAATASAAFNNLSPMSTQGDIIYGGASGAGTRLPAGTSTQVLIGGATPSWAAVNLATMTTGTTPIANGGTGQVTAGAAFNALAPAASANAIIFSNGANTWTQLPAGGAGTLCLIEVAGGAPAWSSCSGGASTSWSNLTAPGADLSLSMGTNNSTFTHGVMTGTRNALEILDGNSTSTGSLLNLHTGASSTMKPFTVTAQGTANGIQINNSGVLAAIGTGGITATSTTLSINTSSPLGGGGAFTGNLTLTCTICVTSGSALTNNKLIAGSGGSQGIASADLSGDVTTSGTLATTIAGNAVTASKSAVVLTRRTCAILIGADNGSAVLANADIAPQLEQCKVDEAATVVEISVRADGGTPNVIVSKRHCTASACTVGANETVSDLTSAALASGTAGAAACSNSGGTTGFDGFTTCSATLQNTSLAIGDYIETHSATAGGVAKRMSIFVTYTVN